MIKINNKFWKFIFNLDRSKKRFILIISDGFIAFAAFGLAFFLRLENFDYLLKYDTYIASITGAATTLLILQLRGLYSTFNRHISIEAAESIAIASVISGLTMLSLRFIFELAIPISVAIIYASIFLIFATSFRFFIRALGKAGANHTPENVCIYGAGSAGIQLLRALEKNALFKVKLFIDDNANLQGQNITGVPIVSLDAAKVRIRELGINTLLLATPSNPESARQRVFEFLSDQPLKIKSIPNINSLISGQLQITELQEIKIEDLLGRKVRKHVPALMAKSLSDKTILVTGAGGSIGGELCRQILKWKPKKLIVLDVSENATYNIQEELIAHKKVKGVEIITVVGSVQDKLLLKRVFSKFCIDTIYHVAAYKHVPLMEKNVMQCIENNVFGTLAISELAISNHVKNFILISTDKAVNPTNFMGASKRIAEIICQTLPNKKSNTSFAIVRFGNVLSSSGSVVPLFKKQIASNGPITVTHPDITRYFMTIKEAAQLVIQAGSMSLGKDVFVLDMGRPIKITDLAKKMVSLSGLTPILHGEQQPRNGEIEIRFTGLRPGEKMFEELFYDSPILPTEHPLIHKTLEKKISKRELKKLISAIATAVKENDYEKLNQAVSTVAKDIAPPEHSIDVLGS